MRCKYTKFNTTSSHNNCRRKDGDRENVLEKEILKKKCGRTAGTRQVQLHVNADVRRRQQKTELDGQKWSVVYASLREMRHQSIRINTNNHIISTYRRRMNQSGGLNNRPISNAAKIFAVLRGRPITVPPRRLRL